MEKLKTNIISSPIAHLRQKIEEGIVKEMEVQRRHV